jgi:signal transduction histidine kinase
LIRDLLDICAIDAGRLTIERAPQDPDKLVSETVETFASLASNASLQIGAHVRRPLPPVAADRGRIAQIFSNLVGNALKFTPAGGRIVIGAEHCDGEVRFSVKDTGPGIPPEDVPHLFDLYWQARSADRRGVGMGLHIAKRIVEAHGGRIWVESARGVGSTFFFTVPLAVSAEPVRASEIEAPS